MEVTKQMRFWCLLTVLEVCIELYILYIVFLLSSIFSLSTSKNVALRDERMFYGLGDTVSSCSVSVRDQDKPC